MDQLLPQACAAHLRERTSGPRADVHLDQAVARHDVQVVALRERSHGLHAPVQRARVHGRQSDRGEAIRERLGLRQPAVVERHAGRPAVERLAGDGGEAVPDQEEGGHRPGSIRRARPASVGARSTPAIAAGRRTSNVEPRPSSLSTVTVPPWFSATWRTMASPEPGAAGLARASPVHAVEALEHAGELLRRDPGPGVAHAHDDRSVVRRHRCDDRAVCLRVADGVVEQVADQQREVASRATYLRDGRDHRPPS